MSLRDAAQQALEVIGWLRLHLQRDHQCLHMDSTGSGIPAWIAKSQTAIRAALAESKSDTSSDYERGFIDGMQKQMQSSVDKAINRMAALAEPAPEPVAWMTFNPVGDEDDIWYVNPEGKLLEGWSYKPLYTTPPQRQPLSASEVAQMLRQYNYEIHGDWATYIVRMTETAHYGIGGGK